MFRRKHYPTIKEMAPIPTNIDLSEIPLDSAKKDLRKIINDLRKEGNNHLLCIEIGEGVKIEDVQAMHSYLQSMGLPYGVFFYYTQQNIKFIDIRDVVE